MAKSKQIDNPHWWPERAWPLVNIEHHPYFEFWLDRMQGEVMEKVGDHDIGQGLMTVHAQRMPWLEGVKMTDFRKAMHRHTDAMVPLLERMHIFKTSFEPDGTWLRPVTAEDLQPSILPNTRTLPERRQSAEREVKSVTSLSIGAGLLEQAKIYARAHNISVSQFACDAMAKMLADEQTP